MEQRPALLAAAALLLPALARAWEVDADAPRYVLCPNSGPLPSAKLPGGVLSVFAASVAQRWSKGLLLHAALLWEDGAGWTPHLPCMDCNSPGRPFETAVANITYDDTRQLSRMSPEEYDSMDKRVDRLRRYAKCYGTPVPDETKFYCAMGSGDGSGPVARNASLTAGDLIHFSNGELHHDFAQCLLDGRVTRRWLRAPGVPNRLVVHLLAVMQVPDGRPTAARVPLELCRAPQTLRRITLCTMPLHGLERMTKEVPYALDDWLAYHLDFLGVDQAEVYDVDGSFASTMQRRGGRGVAYHPRWPTRLSTGLAALSERHPGCSETWAYAHCLATHRALSRWVIILHSPDEYLGVKWNSLTELLDSLNALIAGDDPIGQVFLQSFHWAHGGPGSVDDPLARGAVLASSTVRDHQLIPGWALMDPGICFCAGPHTCYSPVSELRAIYARTLPPDIMVVHHFVEMLARDRGSCAHWALHGCDTADLELPALEFAEFLRTGKRPDGVPWVGQLLEKHLAS